MKKVVKIHGKSFEMTIPESVILEKVKAVAERINEDYAERNPVLVIVLSGAFVFAGDLIRMLRIPCQLSFCKIASYEGTYSTGKMIEQLSVTEDITDRDVIIVEDIVETGYSMQYLLSRLETHHPSSVEICALSCKPQKCMVPGLQVKYVGMELPDAFIVGYGLDYDAAGRELRDIYSLIEE